MGVARQRAEGRAASFAPSCDVITIFACAAYVTELVQRAGDAMTRKLFGTDGIRGTANVEPMTAETALKVAMAAGAHFRRGDHRHLVVIGKDTRLSGYMLEPALAAGFIAMGMDVVL